MAAMVGPIQIYSSARHIVNQMPCRVAVQVVQRLADMLCGTIIQAGLPVGVIFLLPIVLLLPTESTRMNFGCTLDGRLATVKFGAQATFMPLVLKFHFLRTDAVRQVRHVCDAFGSSASWLAN